MKHRTMNVIFHLSDDGKHLVEVKRYVHMAHVRQWCMSHQKADIFIYHARPGLSSWSRWSTLYSQPLRVSGASVLRWHGILNAEPVPFGHPDTWIALSDVVHALP